eukprot:gene10818-13254_t
MSFISIYARKSIGLNAQRFLTGSRVSKIIPQQIQYYRARPTEEDDDDDDSGVKASKISQASTTKIVQRFTKIWKRPEKIAKITQEEKDLRKFMYDFEQYRQKIIDKKDKEELDKLLLQWEAVAELPEDLRRIAMLVDTLDPQPGYFPYLTKTPPTPYDPKDRIVLKKKDPKVKRSESLIIHLGSPST